MRSRGLLGNSALALLGDFAAKASALAVLIIAGHALPVDEFALVATALAYAAVLTAVLDGGAQVLITRDGARSRVERGRVFRALIVARLPFAAGGLAIAVVAGALAGNVWLFGATALLVVAGAALLSLTGVLRASQDLLPEAVFKLFAGVLTVAAATIACRLEPTAGALVSALALAALAILLPLAGAARKRADFVAGIAPLGALRRAFPLGLLVLGALVYYRSGTIALSVLSTDDETARFAIASALAFGLLAVANAVTTGLMPRLAAERDHGARTLVTRRALAWTAGLGVPFAALAALLGPFAIGLLFGSRYRDAAGPFAVLCAALWLIAASSIIGTALIASGHLRPVLRQTVLSLAVNLVVLALLVPELGAYGAALATVACEVVALMVLWRAANRYLPGVVPFGARGAASAALP